MDQAIAGLSAGICSTLVMHPLDLAKVQMQASSNRKGISLIHVLQNNIKYTGSIRSLYHGLGVNMLGSAVSWGTYFYVYGFTKSLFLGTTSSEPVPITAMQTLISSAFAGCIVAAFTNPMWVVKSRILSRTVNYSNPFYGVYHLLKNEGVRGCYAGFTPSLLGVSQGALQFMAYEKLKIWHKGQPSNLDYLFMSAASKVFAAMNMYPLLVVRTRLQVFQPGISMLEMFKKIWRVEGPLAFYKGFQPHLLRVIPQTCITFLVYEQVGLHFKSRASL
ncbi:FAD transporter [Schizosaccharomyces cryophilus OY26]|uniref:FAD transporter n=1 Tax=Schizosaccharomyces cryophilus (strain OY26 / ATCC MYA-4695 / CBS 11777 / NBRC 106824 / NRRL Y48691) TaxID=653667 RepID=S9VSZ8_SCHCR|nr:FAD transporter [Schizosaccharomyces cryophilus OY26]EPY49284.1 FAD transporter [Schizosaccharomyces cryophilus OY26]